MDTPVSQFEDTRTFGPANSFVFTIDGQSGSFMRAGGPGPTRHSASGTCTATCSTT